MLNRKECGTDRQEKAQGMEGMTKMKCRDCGHCVLGGWWTGEHLCEVSGFPVDGNEGICISYIDRKVTGRK